MGTKQFLLEFISYGWSIEQT